MLPCPACGSWVSRSEADRAAAKLGGDASSEVAQLKADLATANQTIARLRQPEQKIMKK